ncbi:Na+/H+ antiporter NhaC family protein [Halanaerobium sp. Z-7514]|uniref:Na+/H+ antiporter NhaC family protein n=1 Tax=Halanaerobium polyolivorans TaxID=2886943 RepID=A0AAW4WUL2_9FIRM|nr:Na+/H+ antiporter NhaC family protein [Halanaerobium polyolivorans]MCC3144792.1 Na+/H+ antiporter NhaC family protein [Halanaerobium polyolivorans]
MDSYGIISLLPPILAIVLAWWSKQVVLSLFLGVFAGAFILNTYNPILAFMATFDNYVLASLADPWNAGIILFLLAMGGMIGIINKSGGIMAIGEYIADRANSVAKTQFATWLMGILIFFDDYANTLIVGNTMRPITDKMKISREKLSFIVDLTAAAVSSIVPISTWIAFEVGVIRDGFDTIGVELNAYTTFIQTIPYRFYSLLALAFALIIIFTGKDYGAMLEAEKRARSTGETLRPGSTPMVSDEIEEYKKTEGKSFTFFNSFAPIIGVIIVTLIGLWYSGGGMEAGVTIQQAYGDADASVVLLWAAVSGSLIAGILTLAKKVLSLEEAVDGWIDGAKSMFVACLILVLAWSIGSIADDLGTASYLVSVLEGNIIPEIVPVMIFAFSAFIAFTIGSSWGTVAIVMPLAIPLAHSIAIPMLPTIGAVLTAAVMGDHCSPISDTTIMSSTASAVDHMDHVRTQMPYALTVGIVAALFGFLPAGFGISAFYLLPVGLIVLYLIVNIFGKKAEDLI